MLINSKTYEIQGIPTLLVEPQTLHVSHLIQVISSLAEMVYQTKKTLKSAVFGDL